MIFQFTECISDRKTRKKLQISESDLAKFSALLGFSPFFYVFPPIDEETLYARAPRVLRASARARTSQMDPGRDGELAEFHMIRALGVLNRCAERRGSDEERTPSNQMRASTDEVGGCFQLVSLPAGNLIETFR